MSACFYKLTVNKCSFNRQLAADSADEQTSSSEKQAMRQNACALTPYM